MKCRVSFLLFAFAMLKFSYLRFEDNIVRVVLCSLTTGNEMLDCCTKVQDAREAVLASCRVNENRESELRLSK